MTAYPGQTQTRTTLGQLCAALWDSQSRPVVIQPGIEPGSIVTPLVLRCSALGPSYSRLIWHCHMLLRFDLTPYRDVRPVELLLVTSNMCYSHVMSLLWWEFGFKKSMCHLYFNSLLWYIGQLGKKVGKKDRDVRNEWRDNFHTPQEKIGEVTRHKLALRRKPGS